jgi:peptidoglycan/xylan/chitin deacetylase (PgdA/CDA1 family)
MLHVIWFVSSSAPSRHEERVRMVKADNLVPESCQRNGLRTLATARIEYPERPIQRGQVGRDLATHEFLPHGIAHHAETGEPRIDPWLEAFLRRDACHSSER